MNLTEFKNEFEIVYDNVASNSAPPLDDYEISVFLTKGQENYVRSIYRKFDKTEEDKRILDALINPGLSTTPINYPSDASFDNSRFFELNDDLMFIINEYVTLNSNINKLKNKKTSVIPYSYDEIDYQLGNPFKFPNEKISWRLDYKRKNGKRVVEILTANNSKPASYIYKYIKYPNPIIISNITETINGLNVPSNTELPEFTHRTIVDEGVKVALEVTSNPRLQSKTQIDKINNN